MKNILWIVVYTIVSSSLNSETIAPAKISDNILGIKNKKPWGTIIEEKKDRWILSNGKHILKINQNKTWRAEDSNINYIVYNHNLNEISTLRGKLWFTKTPHKKDKETYKIFNDMDLDKGFSHDGLTKDNKFILFYFDKKGSFHFDKSLDISALKYISKDKPVYVNCAPDS